jgi:hypothetical protein
MPRYAKRTDRVPSRVSFAAQRLTVWRHSLAADQSGTPPVPNVRPFVGSIDRDAAFETTPAQVSLHGTGSNRQADVTTPMNRMRRVLHMIGG